MKGKAGLTFVFLAVLSFGAADLSYAIGLGGYVQGESGSAEWTRDLNFGPEVDVDGDITRFGAGFVLDTAVAADRLFNYRLNLGFKSFDADLDRSLPDLELFGFNVDNYFGFGIVRSDKIRLWLGPMVRFGLHVGELGREDALLVEAAAGGALGINIHSESNFTFSITTGVIVSAYGGLVGDFDTSDDEDFDGPGQSVFLNLSFIGRLGGEP